MNIVLPAKEHLASYVAALETGWSPDTIRGGENNQEELERIRSAPDEFLELMVDFEARGGPIKLPDGTFVKRLPGVLYWMWDGEFSGSIGFRWQPGTSELPSYVLGHIGYAVVPWKMRRGYATEALRQILPMAKQQGLSYVELTTDPANEGSQKVILANGGYLHERFHKLAAYGGGESLRFRVDL